MHQRKPTLSWGGHANSTQDRTHNLFTSMDCQPAPKNVTVLRCLAGVESFQIVDIKYCEQLMYTDIIVEKMSLA